MLTSRRGFLAGLSALIVAPAIVKATNIMPVKPYEHLLLVKAPLINNRFLTYKIQEQLQTVLELSLFEPNDAVTRATVKNQLESFAHIWNVDDYQIVCDDTNNQIQDIDSNMLKVDVYIKPQRSIEYITLQGMVSSKGYTFEELMSDS